MYAQAEAEFVAENYPILYRVVLYCHMKYTRQKNPTFICLTGNLSNR